MALVDPGGDRHQLDRATPSFLRWSTIAGWASAAIVPRSASGTSGWRMVKRAHMRLVDQPAGRKSGGFGGSGGGSAVTIAFGTSGAVSPPSPRGAASRGS